MAAIEIHGAYKLRCFFSLLFFSLFLWARSRSLVHIGLHFNAIEIHNRRSLFNNRICDSKCRCVLHKSWLALRFLLRHLIYGKWVATYMKVFFNHTKFKQLIIQSIYCRAVSRRQRNISLLVNHNVAVPAHVLFTYRDLIQSEQLASNYAEFKQKTPLLHANQMRCCPCFFQLDKIHSSGKTNDKFHHVTNCVCDLCAKIMKSTSGKWINSCVLKIIIRTQWRCDLNVNIQCEVNL